MRTLIVGVFIVFFILIGGLYGLVWPNTYLSQINISFWPKIFVRSFLETKNREGVNVVVEGKETKIRYIDLEMSLDVEQTMKGLEIKNITTLLYNWWASPVRTTLIQPVFTFGEDFDRLVIEKFPVKPLVNESISYNKSLGLFEYQVNKRKSVIDTVDLLAKLVTFSDVGKKPKFVNMIDQSNELENTVESVNKKLQATINKPIEVVFGANGQKIAIEPKDILDLLEVKTEDLFRTLSFDVDKNVVSRILVNNGVNDVPDWPTKLIADNLESRYNDGIPKPVVLGIDSGPNTAGDIADKYIEVDLSQQKMFFFEKGELYKSYSVSTGLRYPTQVGTYKIKNKIPMGFSAIFNVWMPWWMAFDYREDLSAYLGIHELPYKLVEGEKIYRFGNYIGSRKTGGCVALSPGDSKEVYDKSFPGMDVVVYE